ncbi:MAG: hypothetical protein KF837_11115 [Labilithrix sp.]|nr:hypothetical protein [Labilithrix sp.]
MGRFSRAAILALGTSAAAAGTTIACSSDEPEGSIIPHYGGPPIHADAGADADADPGTNAALYGAPAPPPDSGSSQ